MQKHFASMRSRRQPSVLVFLAQDADTHAFCCANADLRKARRRTRSFASSTSGNARTARGRRAWCFDLQDLGHDEPTILLTNEPRTSPKALITRCAQRMLIENALSDTVRFFQMDALSSAVGLKVDFDMTPLVVASGLYRLLAGRMRG